MEQNTPVTVTPRDVARLRITSWLFVGLMVVLLVCAFVVPVQTQTVQRTCAVGGGEQLGIALLSSSVACIDVSAGRTGIYLVLVLLSIWLAAACNGEAGWKGLKNAIFSPDGNESPVLSLVFYTVFFFVTVENVHFTVWPNFLASVAFYVGRNGLTALLFNVIAVRLLGIRSIDAYLREQKTPLSTGLVIFQGLALVMAFFFWRALGV